MIRTILVFFAILFIAGCDIPYKAEYDKAMELKEQAEKKAEQAQNALTAEQNAIKRLYTED